MFCNFLRFSCFFGFFFKNIVNMHCLDNIFFDIVKKLRCYKNTTSSTPSLGGLEGKGELGRFSWRWESGDAKRSAWYCPTVSKQLKLPGCSCRDVDPPML